MRTRLGLWLIVIVSATLAGPPRIERPSFASARTATISAAVHGVESPALREAQPGPVYDVFRPQLLAPPPGAAVVVVRRSPPRTIEIELAQPSCLPARPRALGARAPPALAA